MSNHQRLRLLFTSDVQSRSPTRGCRLREVVDYVWFQQSDWSDLYWRRIICEDRYPPSSINTGRFMRRTIGVPCSIAFFSSARTSATYLSSVPSIHVLLLAFWACPNHQLSTTVHDCQSDKTDYRDSSSAVPQQG